MLHHCALCHIDLDRISVRRGGQVLLQDVSMHIHCGQLTVLIGQNGAGKTTLIKALLGQIPHTGVIRHVDSRGLDIPHLRTGYVPQVLQFDREMPLTVQDFIAASMARRPVWLGTSRKTWEKVRQVLADVDAAELADRPLGRCSGGELQRVLLALALQPAPDLLVLDEPVSGIDRNGMKMFLETLLRMREEGIRYAVRSLGVLTPPVTEMKSVIYSVSCPPYWRTVSAGQVTMLSGRSMVA